MSRLFMARHGQASFGKANYDLLSEKGQRQCRILGEYMIRTGLSFDAIYAGTLVRQQETARAIIESYREQGIAVEDFRVMPEFDEYRSRDIVTAHLPDIFREEPDLQPDSKENNRGLYLDEKTFSRVFEKIMVRWMSGVDEKPGLPSWKEFRDRVGSGIRKVLAENGPKKNVLICTSGGPISVAVQMALDLSDEKAFRIGWNVVNSSVTSFFFKGDQMTLASFNQKAHLELLKDPAWVTFW